MTCGEPVSQGWPDLACRLTWLTRSSITRVARFPVLLLFTSVITFWPSVSWHSSDGASISRHWSASSAYLTKSRQHEHCHHHWCCRSPHDSGVHRNLGRPPNRARPHTFFASRRRRLSGSNPRETKGLDRRSKGSAPPSFDCWGGASSGWKVSCRSASTRAIARVAPLTAGFRAVLRQRAGASFWFANSR